MKKYKIEIAVDNAEGKEFVAWLNKNGHDASLGTSTGNYINGDWTSTDENANQILNDLWNKYCNSSAAATLGSIRTEKKAASSRENGKKGGRPKYATTLHSDGTVTYWSVYRQAWVRRVDIGSIPDAELAAMSSTERDKILSRR